MKQQLLPPDQKQSTITILSKRGPHSLLAADLYSMHCMVLYFTMLLSTNVITLLPPLTTKCIALIALAR